MWYGSEPHIVVTATEHVKQVWDAGLGRGCGTQVWDGVGRRRGTRVWDGAVGRRRWRRHGADSCSTGLGL
eukprot:364210-Chlamydomonas_euryale.AAC.1